jgi:type IV fimbrial biogenesis protein FimT
MSSIGVYNQKRQSMNAQRGLTMIELLISMLILGILSAIAVPSFQKLIVSSSITSDANSLMSDLAIARSEAARTGGPVTVCLSSNGTSCATSATNWSMGRIVFTDNATGGTVGTVDSGETILRYTATIANSSNIITASNVPNTTYITYTSTGIVSGVVNGTDATFRICRGSPSKYPGTTVTISVTGRASAATVVCP